MAYKFIVRNWGAWAPGLSSREEWRLRRQGRLLVNPEAPPAQTLAPKSLQRRQSYLARMVLHAIGQCVALGEILPAVFSSAHGEISRCLQMLENLQAGEEISPTAFSLSVHNAVAGWYSVVYANHAEHTVLASGAGGIGPGFIEALGILQEGHAEVLLVFYDEPLPAFFPTVPFVLSADFPCALALRLAEQGEGLALSFDLCPTARHDGEQALQVPMFIDFMLSQQTRLILGDQSRSWQWQKV